MKMIKEWLENLVMFGGLALCVVFSMVMLLSPFITVIVVVWLIARGFWH